MNNAGSKQEYPIVEFDVNTDRDYVPLKVVEPGRGRWRLENPNNTNSLEPYRLLGFDGENFIDVYMINRNLRFADFALVHTFCFGLDTELVTNCERSKLNEAVNSAIVKLLKR